GRGLAFRRGTYAESHLFPLLKRKPVREADWVLAGLQNRQLPGRAPLDIIATLEKDIGVARPKSKDNLKTVRPGWAWFEVPPPGAKDAPPRLHVRALSGYPAPAYGLHLPQWPKGAAPSLRAWWSESAPPSEGDLRPADRR